MRAASPVDDSNRKSGRHVSRASLACSRCKKAKRRCDYPVDAKDAQSTQPKSCTLCKIKNEKCDVRVEDDRRRGKHRGKTKDLRSRLEALEQFVLSSGNSVDEVVSSPQAEQSTTSDISIDDVVTEHTDGQPAPSAEDPDPWNAVFPNEGIENAALQNGPASPLTQHRHVSPESYRFASITKNLVRDVSELRPARDQRVFNFQDNSNALQGDDFDHSNTVNSSLSRVQPSMGQSDSSSVLGEFTARAGELKGGNTSGLRYFGATSMFVHADRHQDSLTSEKGTLSRKARRMSATAIDADEEPSPIVAHLLDLFFDWQASHLNVINRDMFIMHKRLFEEDKDYDDRDFYSPTLLYAMMSLASLISPDRGVRRYSRGIEGEVGEVFLRKARQLLDVEVHSPSTTTVQAALLIASWYGAVGQTSLGWSYSGLTFRMCYDLGIHMDCSSTVLCGKITPEVIENHERIFWGCYTQDKLWSAYCGRPSFFMDWDISVKVLKGPPSSPSQQSSDTDQSMQIREGIIYLSRKCSEVLLTLYSQRNSSKLDDLLQHATNIHKELYTWRKQLPLDIDWPRNDGSVKPLPGVLILHMQFYFTLILTHRPLLHISDAQRAVAICDEGPVPLAAVCTLAATNIAKLVRDYQQFYSLKRISSPAVHFTFIAATIHLVDFCLFKAQKHHFLLQGCISALTEMGDSYPIGQKAVNVLQTMMERWKAKPNPWEEQQEFLAQTNSVSLSRLYSKYSFSDGPRAWLEGSNTNKSAFNEIERAIGTDTDQTQNPSFPFDWSEYSSPIEMPPLFDASMMPMPNDGFGNNAVVAPLAQFDSLPQAQSGGCSVSFPRHGTFDQVDKTLENWDSFDETTLASFYGTSFALMNSS